MENTDTYFHALACFVCKRNRLYRIYIRANELIFIWAGKGSEGVAGVRLEGGNYLASLFDPWKENTLRSKILDDSTLEMLISDHPYNFRASIREFEEVRICQRSDRHARLFSDHAHQALLYMRHRSIGKCRLGIASLHDTQVALKEIPNIFRGRCRVEIKWPEREQKCGCRICVGNREYYGE